MKKLVFILFFILGYTGITCAEDADEQTKILLPSCNTIKDFQQFVGKTFTYFPVKNNYNSKFVDRFGIKKRELKVRKIKKGLDQEWDNVLRTNWVLDDVKSDEKLEFVVYSGDESILKEKYSNLTWDDEVRFFDMPLFNCIGDYYMTLSSVEKPESPEIQYGNIETITDSIKKYRYEDNYIDITLYGHSLGVAIILKNKSQHTLKIIWDEASFVDIDGTTSKIMHNGIKYSERENAQSPSTIIRGATLVDDILPTRNVYYNKSVNEWKALSIFPLTPFGDNSKAILMLPIQIKGVTNEYVFVFDFHFDYQLVL